MTDLIARLQMMLEVEFSQYLSIFFCHKGIKGEFFQNIFPSFRAVGSGIIFVKSLCSALMEAWLYLEPPRIDLSDKKLPFPHIQLPKEKYCVLSLLVRSKGGKYSKTQ